MKNLLPRAAVCVDDRAVAIFRDAEFLGKIRNCGKQSAEELCVFFRGVIQSRYVCFWNYQNVGRGGGANVFEGKNFVILENFFRRDFAARNFAEDAVF